MIMKKTLTVAAVAIAALGLASPAHADDHSNFDGPVDSADNWDFAAGVVAIQEAAVVPVLDGTPGYVGDNENNASNGNNGNNRTHPRRLWARRFDSISSRSASSRKKKRSNSVRDGGCVLPRAFLSPRRESYLTLIDTLLAQPNV